MRQEPIVTYELLDTASALRKAVKSLQKEDTIGVDMEADSMFHFQDRVCLIQIASRRHLYIVDPIQIEGLHLLKPLFGDRRIKKVFHGADYDIRSLFRDFGITVHNLFDTELACRFLGIQQSGLDAVVQSFFNVKLEKRFQKKDWSKRPLSEAMMTYAAKDVHHLLSLAKLLERQLLQKKRMDWVREECDLLSKVRPNPANNAPLFMNFKGAGKLSRKDLAVLEAVLVWRKQTAQKKDLPLFKIMGNATISTLVRKKPQTLKELADCQALSAKQISMYGHQVVVAVSKGFKTPDDDCPFYPRKKTPRIPQTTARMARCLKNWKEAKADSLAIDPALVLNKSQIMDIAKKSPEAIHHLNDIASLKSWQIREFGAEIIQSIQT